MNTLKRYKNYLLIGSLVGLTAGLGLGIVAGRTGSPLMANLAAIVDPVGKLWINALRMIVLPLIIAYIVTAVASFSEVKSTFRIGGGAVLAHLLLMVMMMGLMIAIQPPLIDVLDVSPETTEALRAATVDMPELAERPSSTGAGAMISQLIPPNLFRAAVDEQILPLYIAALLFALALIRVSERHRRIIVDFFMALIETFHVLIGWILMAMPFAVFALIYNMALNTGMSLLTALAYFIVLFCGLMILVTLLLYVVTPLLGKVSVGDFAQAAAPAQAVAAGTRSSLVCLPTLVEGAREHLRLPESVVGLVLPLSVSMFKINTAVTAPLRLFFLAHLYGISFVPGELVFFFAAYTLLSFSTPGIPSGSTWVSLPLFIAVGIPVEGVVMLRAVDAIPDIFMTVANVTEDLSIATIVSRFAGAETVAPDLAMASARIVEC